MQTESHDTVKLSSSEFCVFLYYMYCKWSQNQLLKIPQSHWNKFLWLQRMVDNCRRYSHVLYPTVICNWSQMITNNHRRKTLLTQHTFKAAELDEHQQYYNWTSFSHMIFIKQWFHMIAHWNLYSYSSHSPNSAAILCNHKETQLFATICNRVCWQFQFLWSCNPLGSY